MMQKWVFLPIWMSIDGRYRLVWMLIHKVPPEWMMPHLKIRTKSAVNQIIAVQWCIELGLASIVS